MSYFDKIFISNINDILDRGTEYESRAIWKDTGEKAHCIKLFGLVNRYDLSDPKQLPVGTLRRLYYKSAIDELFWIWSDKSNNINDLPSHIWDDWADRNGSIGAAYGFQVKSKLRKASHEVIDKDGNTKIISGYYDQMDYVLHELTYNKYSRRILTDLYSIDQTELMGLDPCCYSCTWGVTRDQQGYERLNLLLNQRSQDMLVANNWNVFQYSILLYTVAYSVGLKPGTLTHVIADAHIYDRHIPLVKRVCENQQYDAPELIFNPGEYQSVRDRFYFMDTENFELKDYKYSEFNEKIPVAV